MNRLPPHVPVVSAPDSRPQPFDRAEFSMLKLIPRDAECIRVERRAATEAADRAYEFQENGFCKAHDSVTCLVCRDRAAERRHRELPAAVRSLARL